MSDTEKKYFVDFGPELLKLLGPNLYTNIYFVLGEIIANAYDADANNVYILYDTSKETIIIEDDGNGMTYDQFNNQYLPIGINTRNGSTGIYTESGRRKRMGRKGIGKLAALSVSKQIIIMSTRDGEKSGCILSTEISQKNSKGRYEIPGIDEEDIHFQRINPESHGSAIIMENSKYSIHKTIKSAKRNIGLIFPFTSSSFIINIENLETGEKATLENSTKDIVTLSDALLTFSDEGGEHQEYFDRIQSYFNNNIYYDEIVRTLGSNSDKIPAKKELNKKKTAIREKLTLTTLKNEEKDFDIVIYGWIATYKSTSSKKNDADFPPNHISIFANGKMGKFDILSEISTDRMGEAYVVGEFHIDLLEESELPDIASSNRQGYKEDDIRYIKTLELIKKNALRPILELKKDASTEKNYLKELAKLEDSRQKKQEFDNIIREMTSIPRFKTMLRRSPEIKEKLEKAWELKDTLKETNKKLMISHTSKNKDVIDELERALIFCGFTADQIIYTSSDNSASTIDAYTDIYEYLRDFFINTVLRQDLGVIYVLSDEFKDGWDPVLEAGAGWVVNTTCYPVFTDHFASVREPFPRTSNTPKLAFGMNIRDINRLASALHKITTEILLSSPTEAQIRSYLLSTPLS